MNSINGELITRITLCGDEEDFEKMENIEELKQKMGEMASDDFCQRIDLRNYCAMQQISTPLNK